MHNDDIIIPDITAFRISSKNTYRIESARLKVEIHRAENHAVKRMEIAYIKEEM